MPKSNAPQQPELEEVERAISVLEGRHPEHERTRRETLAAAEERRGEIERELAASWRKRLRRTTVITANLIAVGIAGYVVSRLVSRATGIREGLAREEAPFLSHGYTEVASNEITARTTLEVDTPASTCLVAISTGATLRVQTGTGSGESNHSLGWCECAASHAKLETTAPPGSTPGLTLLRIDAHVVGGPMARSWLSVDPERWIDSGGGTCAESLLDGWIADGHFPKSTTSDESFDASAQGKSLRARGFALVGELADEHPFTVVESRAGDCALAISPQARLSLRTPGGTRVIDDAQDALAWCSSAALALTVWRATPTGSPVVIAAAPADHVGGMLGTIESAREVGVALGSGATWLRAEDAAWDASAVLRASRLDAPAGEPVPGEPGARDTRVTAVVFTPDARLAWMPDDAVVACDPPLSAAAAPGLAESVCAAASPVAWWRRGDAPAHDARAALPFWLTTFDGRHEPDAVARIPELLVLARTLSRRGFEPTVLEGVTEMPSGVRVVGRAGEDAIVAVGLAPRPPWVFPYSDGDAWELGDSPRVVELQPGTAVTLTSTPPPSAPVDRRRTVVFRHASHL